MGKLYKYYLRPGYGSDKLLLEFLLDSSDTKFDKDLLTTLKDINPKVNTVEDFWMNEEILLQVSSDKGSFLLSKYVWDVAFIMAEENQSAIEYIDEILSNSNLFDKEEVDFGEYKSSKT
jgi:hypothetical protein